jgi:primase-polymerase (primpol)-like protein
MNPTLLTAPELENGNLDELKATALSEGNVAKLVQILREELKRNHSNIPKELKERKAWLLYKVTQIVPQTGKFNKIPAYAKTLQQRSGTQGNPSDLANLCTWDELWPVFLDKVGFAGVGLAMLSQFELVALDADKCVTNGQIREDVLEITRNTYREFSPSKTGIRCFWLGKADDGKNHDLGFELFHNKGFVTVTGSVCK